MVIYLRIYLWCMPNAMQDCHFFSTVKKGCEEALRSPTNQQKHKKMKKKINFAFYYHINANFFLDPIQLP